MVQEFYSNGKLLLSGEYAILDGAYGWAVPTKYGQYLKVTDNDTGHLSWKSLDHKGKPWFHAVYDIERLNEISCSDKKLSHGLLQILSEAKALNPDFLSGDKGCTIETRLTFPRNWGLGTSSTLINNIARWAKVDPYRLLAGTFGGSGYDIAAALYNTPILYHIDKGHPKVREIAFHPRFKEGLFFIYLNKKRNSREAISEYRTRQLDKTELVHRISQITEKLVATQSIDDFMQLISQHEHLLSEALGVQTIKAELFPDYVGAIKSLGAWGGDFVLAVGPGEETLAYFKGKGFDTVIPYSEMVLV